MWITPSSARCSIETSESGSSRAKLDQEPTRHDNRALAFNAGLERGTQRSSMSVAASVSCPPSAFRRMPPRICTAVRVETPRETTASFWVSSSREQATFIVPEPTTVSASSI